jgi:arylsulfatase A-like enzyme
MPYQALHAARAKHTVAPQNYMDMFAYIASDKRRRLAAMAYSVDESVGLIVDRLHSKGMLDNSIIVFASDNGAHPDGILATELYLQYSEIVISNFLSIIILGNGGSNWPFRGNKTELFEGGQFATFLSFSFYF